MAQRWLIGFGCLFLLRREPALGAGLIGIGMNRWRRHDHPGGAIRI